LDRSLQRIVALLGRREESVERLLCEMRNGVRGQVAANRPVFGMLFQLVGHELLG